MLELAAELMELLSKDKSFEEKGGEDEKAGSASVSRTRRG